jgi:bifunctional lysine-specific demethylase and histidyl-hydroxylase NO66
VTLGEARVDRTIATIHVSALGRCVGDPDGFIRQTWGTRAVVHRGADPHGFSDLLSPDDVDRLLSTASLRTPTFRLIEAGRTLPESSYTRSGRTGSKPVQGMADPSRIFERFRLGATIVLQGLHRYHAQLTRFCRELELELGHPCQANAYITPPGAQGLALHADPHDVLVLQTFGRKRWEIHPAPREAERRPLEQTLRTGDCAYMPAGTPHAASTQETISGHITIGVHVSSWRTLLDDVWRRVAEDPAFAEPVPAGWHRDLDATADELRARVGSAAAALAAEHTRAVVDDAHDRFLSSRSQLVRGLLLDQLELDRIGDETPLRRREGAICEIRRRDEAVVALLGDRRLEMPSRLEPAMRIVAGSSVLTAADLAASIPDREGRLVLVRRLVREGLLAPDDPR